MVTASLLTWGTAHKCAQNILSLNTLNILQLEFGIAANLQYMHNLMHTQGLRGKNHIVMGTTAVVQVQKGFPSPKDLPIQSTPKL